MSEKMLVTQALDERDLLVKKIRDKIAKADFVDTKKANEEKVYATRLTQEEFAKKAKAAYQQILDLIDRFQKLDAAIVASNAATFIETSYGKMSVAGAIAMRNRLRSKGTYTDQGDFEGFLYNRMSLNYSKCLSVIEDKNRALQSTAAEMRFSILGRDTKVKDDKPLDVVEAYVKENTTELIDPLDIKQKMEALTEKRIRS
ncbi:hypothetical protein P261_01800 [Lachnospiraceae bacterium TWA4]|nr:hypothetical protein P261_01800 [Lachnospiraceae bacterium TWA4]